MDIRNFNEPVPAPTPGTIEEIFTLQRALLDKYVSIEKMQAYPVNIDSPDAQVLIKDFIARVTEELGEGYESYLHLVHSDLKGTLNRDIALPLLYNFNEEIADAIHFLVETMIVCNMAPDTINKFLAEEALSRGFFLAEGDTYNSILVYLYHVLDMPTLTGDERARLDLGDKDCVFIQGGRFLSPIMERHTALLMWNVTYYLQLARNSLKNKPWKQTQMLSDHRTFKVNIIAAFIALVALCEEVGINEESFFNIYLAKNQVNQFRINSKY